MEDVTETVKLLLHILTVRLEIPLVSEDIRYKVAEDVYVFPSNQYLVLSGISHINGRRYHVYRSYTETYGECE